MQLLGKIGITARQDPFEETNILSLMNCPGDDEGRLEVGEIWGSHLEEKALTWYSRLCVEEDRTHKTSFNTAKA